VLNPVTYSVLRMRLEIELEFDVDFSILLAKSLAHSFDALVNHKQVVSMNRTRKSHRDTDRQAKAVNEV
jgi:hypothetical protein